MNRILFCMLALVIVGFLSCKKERSLENSNKIMSDGSLQSDATGECLPKNLQGAFIVGTSLGSSNFIEVDVEVVSSGPFNITTDTINGYYFSATGEFAATGIETVKLMGKGKPLADGVDYFTVYYDSSYCTIDVPVLPSSAAGPAVFTLQSSGTSCLNYAVNGSYVKSVALTSANKVSIEVNVSTIGTYSISTAATNGMSFTATGAFAATGVQTVVLTGSGMPVNSGAIAVPVTAGSSNCSFTVNVAATATPPPPTSTYFWKFTSGGVLYQGSVDSINAEMGTETYNGTTIATFAFYGESVTGDTTMSLILGDLSGGFTANENYVSTATTTNSLFFSMEDGSGVYDADPVTTGSNLSVKVTSHNTVSKIIEGTFSGTVKDSSTGTSKTITNGQFKVNYP